MAFPHHKPLQATLAACPSKATLGQHLAQRLIQIGVNDVFSVPGDFNLNLVGCCNERNAGYARSHGTLLLSDSHLLSSCCE
ncbi:hypothetical protein Ancab_001523 [Ancistrocladus abbreviatus]